MRGDEKISNLENKLVGSSTSTSNIGDLNSCLCSFIRQLYKLKSEYTPENLAVEYKRFEDFFYSSELIKQDKTRLYNFDFQNDNIDLGDGIKIKKCIDFDENNINSSVNLSGYSSFSKSSFFIEREYRIKKIVGSLSLSDNIEKSEGISSSDVFDAVITSFRLLKSSAIYRGHEIQSKLISFSPSNAIVTTRPFFENIVIGEKCELKETEINELIEIYKYIITENDSRFRIAIRRLTSGIERKNIEDKLIDYMIAFETLYLPDGNAELSFRLSLRIAFILKSTPEERKKTFEFFKKIYEIRSKIVHGNDYKLSNENVSEMEDLLRNSIKLWIKNKEIFLHKITENGKTVDGKLNSIFFE